jgi:hypothetical protein
MALRGCTLCTNDVILVEIWEPRARNAHLSSNLSLYVPHMSIPDARQEIQRPLLHLFQLEGLSQRGGNGLRTPNSIFPHLYIEHTGHTLPWHTLYIVRRRISLGSAGISISLFSKWQPLRAQCCQSQPPRCLRHVPPSPGQTLGSLVRVSLKAWMSVSVYSVFVVR